MNKDVKDSLDKLKAEVKRFDADVKNAAKEGRATKDLEAGNERIKKHLDDLDAKLRSEGSKIKARAKKSS